MGGLRPNWIACLHAVLNTAAGSDSGGGTFGNDSPRFDTARALTKGPGARQ